MVYDELEHKLEQTLRKIAKRSEPGGYREYIEEHVLTDWAEVLDIIYVMPSHLIAELWDELSDAAADFLESRLKE